MPRRPLPQSLPEPKPTEGLGLVRAVGRALVDKKAERIVMLDVREQQTFCDYIAICHGTSDRHVIAIAHHVVAELQALGAEPLGVEGATQGHWVLADFGDVVVNVFYEPTRDYYDLEGLWASARRLNLNEWAPAPEPAAKKPAATRTRTTRTKKTT